MPKISTKKSFDELVVGMGPIGLAAAYNLARKGHTIVIIEQRSENDVAVRPQPVLIIPSVKKQLLEMIREGDELNDKDLKFINNLLVSSEVKISSIQKFILRRIKSLNKYYEDKGSLPPVTLYFNTKLKHLNLEAGIATTESTENSTLSTHQATKQDVIDEYTQILTSPESPSLQDFVTSKDMEEELDITTTNDIKVDMQQATLEQKEEIKILPSTNQGAKLHTAPSPLKEEELPQIFHFKHIIAADGASAPTLELAHKESHVKIERKTPKNKEYVASECHFGAYLTLKSNKPFVLPDKDLLTVSIDGKLCLLRFYPKSHSNNKTSVKIGFVGEVPNTIYNEPNETERREKALAYAKIAIAKRLKLSSHELEIEITQSQTYKYSKEKVKIVFFKGKSLQATKAFENQGGHYFCLAGDNYFTPYYRAGHGFNDGMEAVAFLANMPTDINDLEQFMIDYQKLVEKNAKEAQKEMTFLRYLSPIPFIGSKLLPQYLENSVAKWEDKYKINITSVTKSKHINVPVQAVEQIFNDIMSSFTLICKGSPQYKIGFISAKNLTDPIERTLTDLSLAHGGIPIVIVDLENNNEITIQSFMKRGRSYFLRKEYSTDFFQNIYQGRLRDKPSTQNSFDQAPETEDKATTKNPLEEVFISEELIIVRPSEDNKDYFIPEHYQNLSNEVIENIKSKFITMQNFVKQYPNIFIQYYVQIMTEFVKTKGILIKYPERISLYGTDVFNEMQKAAASFLFTILHSDTFYDKDTIQFFLKGAISLDIPEVIPLLVARGASQFLPLSNNKTLLFNLLNLEPPNEEYLIAYANKAITLEFLMLFAEPSNELNKEARKNLSLKVVEKLIIQIGNDEIFDNLSEESLLSLVTRYGLYTKDVKESLKSHLLKYLLDDLRPKLISDQIKLSAQVKKKGSSLDFISSFTNVTQNEISQYSKTKQLIDAIYSSMQYRSSSISKEVCKQLVYFLLRVSNNSKERDTVVEQVIQLLKEPRFKDYREAILKNLFKQLSQHIQKSSQVLDDLINIFYLCQKLNLLSTNHQTSFSSTTSKDLFNSNLITIQQHISVLLSSATLDSKLTPTQEKAIDKILSLSSPNSGKIFRDENSTSEFKYL
ncbi:Uncharacterised protein [Legionella busanensis]|uniref:Uncharacterized protein n=1 Tax=Legionella busanensis TaxID=190655 RepID=A0A378JLN1_9GAMM|nr:hypothetical protein [Legionella busanensis]STX51598.1 Uncharacterised protein [Legionella busanensis]